MRVQTKGYDHYPDPGTFGYEGLTAADVDIENGDLSDGFYVATIADGDFAYEGTESYV